MYNGDSKNNKLSTVFAQVSKVITSMLQNLAYIYKANGINYDVDNYHTVIMRILSPIELFNAEKERSGWAIFPQANEDHELTSRDPPKIKEGEWERYEEDQNLSDQPK